MLRDRMKLDREDGSTVWISFLESTNPLKKRYQVTQQVAAKGSYKTFETFWEEEHVEAFNKLVKEEQLEPTSSRR